jgi:hypothetical protein
VLLGTALRARRIPVLGNVRIYAFGVYASPDELPPEWLSPDWQPPGGGEATAAYLMPLLQSSLGEKTLCLTFLRSVNGGQIAKGMEESLCGVAGVKKEEVEALGPALQGASVAEGASVWITLRPREGVVATALPGAEKENTVTSHELIRGLHEVFFGPKSIVLGLEDSFRRRRDDLLVQFGTSAQVVDSDDEVEAPVSPGAETPPMRPSSPSQVARPVVHYDGSAAGIPAQQSGEAHDESASQVDATRSDPAQARAMKKRRSWKEAAGREDGGDGYTRGDMVRSFMQKRRSNSSFIASSVLPPEAWPGPLVQEGAADWVGAADVPLLQEEAIAAQHLEGSFYKHHTSAVRGTLLPEWTVRHLELSAGTLKYRRFTSRARFTASLDGAYVVAEETQVSPLGNFYICRVVFPGKGAGAEPLRISCTSAATAREWALAMAAACRHFHERAHPASAVIESPEGSQTAGTTLTPPSSRGARSDSQQGDEQSSIEVGERPEVVSSSGTGAVKRLAAHFDAAAEEGKAPEAPPVTPKAPSPPTEAISVPPVTTKARLWPVAWSQLEQLCAQLRRRPAIAVLLAVAVAILSRRARAASGARNVRRARLAH